MNPDEEMDQKVAEAWAQRRRLLESVRAAKRPSEFRVPGFKMESDNASESADCILTGFEGSDNGEAVVDALTQEVKVP